MNLFKIFKNGIFNENPVLIQLVGLCSVLALSNNAKNSFGMGMAVIVVLVGSNLVISLMRKFIPDKIRIPIFIVVVATFVTMVEMFMKAFAQPLYQALGIFLPLIVVNCIILARAESFAYKNKPLASVVDGLGMGLGYTFAITLLAIVRELIGAGTFFGMQLFGESFQPAGVFIAPPGAFILLAIFIALFKTINKKKATN